MKSFDNFINEAGRGPSRPTRSSMSRGVSTNQAKSLGKVAGAGTKKDEEELREVSSIFPISSSERKNINSAMKASGYRAEKEPEFVKFGNKEVMELVYSQSGSKEITLHFDF